MDLPDLLVLVLATWRISSLLAVESGPYQIMDRFRYRIGVRYDEQSRQYGTNVVAKGIICMWCNSFWVGVIITIAIQFIPAWLFLPLALSAGVIFLSACLTLTDK